MGFCDPNESGVDYCSEYANSTINHIDCATGWTDEADYGRLDLGGCDVGCGSCLDYPSEMVWHADYRDGVRWLRPMGDALDAMGRRHDLRTGQAWPVPHGAAYGFGSCYHNETGEECFNRSVCRAQCWPGGLALMWAGEMNNCPNGAALGDPIDSWFPDVYYYAGDTWPPHIYCRRFHFPNGQAAPLGDARLYGGRLHGPAFPRFGQVPFASTVAHNACSPDALVPCVGRFTGSSCPGCYANEPGLPPGAEHWNHSQSSRYRFDRLRINGAGCAVVGGPTRAAQAEADLRSRVLQHVFTTELPAEWPPTDPPRPPMRFDRLDHQADQAGGDIRLWSRRFNPLGDPGYLDDPRTIAAVLPDCRAPSGELVPILVHVLSAEVAAMLVWHRVATWTGPRTPDRYDVELHVRIFAGVTISYRVAAPDTPEPAAGTRYIDRQGRAFRPPAIAEWYGYRGHLGIGGVLTYPVDTGGTLERMCDSVLNELWESVDVHGWPNRRDPGSTIVAWPFTGTLKLRFG